MTSLNEKIFLGPFKFLALSFITSEILFGAWLILIGNNESAERIVIGSLSVAVLIAIVVVFCVVYFIKRKYDEMAYSRCNDTSNDHVH